MMETAESVFGKAGEKGYFAKWHTDPSLDQMRQQGHQSSF
jgi:hypothetical protein